MHRLLFAPMLAFVCVCAPGSLARSSAEDLPAQTTSVPLERTLLNWQTAASQVRTPGRLQRLAFQQAYGSDYSAHELAVLQEFSGPVSVEDLKRRFVWQLVDVDQQTILIKARPRETSEQLFYKHIFCRISRVSGLPTSVEFSQASDNSVPKPALAPQFAFRNDVEVPSQTLLAHASSRHPLQLASGHTMAEPRRIDQAIRSAAAPVATPRRDPQVIPAGHELRWIPIPHIIKPFAVEPTPLPAPPARAESALRASLRR